MTAMTHMPAEVQRTRTHALITETLAMAYRRGLTIPAGIVKAKALREAVHAFADGATEVPPAVLPDKPADIPAAVSKVAAARAQLEHARKVAVELQPLAAERFVGEIRAVMADWVQPLTDTFAEHVTAFRVAAASAPPVHVDQLAQLTPVDFAAWQDAQAAAIEIEAVVEDRRILATALGETFESSIFGDLLPLVAVLTPPNGAMTDALNRDARERVPILQAIGKGTPTPVMTRGGGPQPLVGVARWRALTDAEQRGWLRLSLAGLGEDRQRLQLVDGWAQVVPHLFADSQNQGGSLAHDLLDRMDATYKTLVTVPSAA